MPSTFPVRLYVRRHWLALALVLLYLLRWAQYVAEAVAYRAQPAPGGAGDALGWLLLGQLFFAGALGLGLLGSAWWHREHWRFYLGLGGGATVLALEAVGKLTADSHARPRPV